MRTTAAEAAQRLWKEDAKRLSFQAADRSALCTWTCVAFVRNRQERHLGNAIHLGQPSEISLSTVGLPRTSGAIVELANPFADPTSACSGSPSRQRRAASPAFA